MLKEDYLMRLVRQFTSTLARIVGLKKAEQYPQALEAINQAYQEIFGVNSRFVYVLSEQDLLRLMESGGTLDPDKAIVMAGLLTEEAECYERQNQLNECRPRHLKALSLLLEASFSGRETSFPDLPEKIEGLVGKLKEEGLELELRERLLRFRSGPTVKP
jgi:hypothetical protein